MEFGSGLSANNAACIYSDIGDISTAVTFWKLSAFLKIQRAAENLANKFKKIGDLKCAQDWYHYAFSMGSIDISLQKDSLDIDPEVEKSFDAEKFKLQLQEDVEQNTILAPILRKINRNRNPLAEQALRKLEGSNESGIDFFDKAEAIRFHRNYQKRVSQQRRKDGFRTAAANFVVSSSGVDLIHMEEIFFRGTLS